VAPGLLAGVNMKKLRAATIPDILISRGTLELLEGLLTREVLNGDLV
jgi:hypothetical protein